MKRPRIEVYWGEEPAEPSERQFLAQLKVDLNERGVSAIILANFFTSNGSRQIDFLVAAEAHVCHVELKNYSGILVGQRNGPWSTRQPDGSLEVIERQNPYAQTADGRFSISDDMHAFTERNEGVPRPASGKRFYTQFDSTVCVFRRLQPGSQVPSDYKVQTLGYAELLTLLTTPGARPTWSREHWLAFIRMHGLVPATESGAAELPLTKARDLVVSYARRFKSFHGRSLHELIALPLQVGGNTVPSTQLFEGLGTWRHAQLVGRSGSGKSHLAKHTALAAVETGYVPVFLAAGMYEGRLSKLLDRSVARFANNNADELTRAASLLDKDVLLVVDGLNECSASLVDQFLGDLSAFCLRTPVLTLVTSQVAVELPEPMSGHVVQMGSVGKDDRQAILASYGAPDIAELCEPFATPYELAIASECAAELSDTPTSAGLLAAFVRKRLSGLAEPATTRDVLRAVALKLDEQVATSLPLDQVWSVVEKHLAQYGAPASIVDDALGSTLVTTELGRFTFAHELIGRFLAAEALSLRHRELPGLAKELEKPRHVDLAGYVVGLEHDRERANKLLLRLANTDLFVAALAGDLGPLAERATQTAARRVLEQTTRGMETATILIHPGHELAISGGHKLSRSDRALLSAIGTRLRQGKFIDEVVALLDATDAACRRSADTQALAERRRPTPTGIVAAILVGMGGDRSEIAAWHVLESCRISGWGFETKVPESSDDRIKSICSEANAGTYGRLLLLCYLLHHSSRLDLAPYALRLLRLCWDSTAYHLQLDGLDTIRSFAATTEGHPIRKEIVSFLEGLNTENIFLSTQLVETMYSYDMVEPQVDDSYVREQIAEILRTGFTPENGELANGIVSSQFEDIVGPPHFSAIEALSESERVALFTIASLGAGPLRFWNDWILKQLIKSGRREALPAFEHWATNLSTDSPLVQEVATCYFLAMQGCARFLDYPPKLASRSTADEEAWECYGSIVFWTSHPSAEQAAAERCKPLWRKLRIDLKASAADPLHWIAQPGILAFFGLDEKPLIGQLLRAFPDEIRTILEWSLKHQASLTSIFGDRRFGNELAEKIVHLLGCVGDAGTVELLRAYTDDKALGRDAIRSLRMIQGR
ncbi:NERD domain-containing protein [Micromonospora gifhornensis]|uniref:NERD domain-containing protein n=1 Tax=Micromonospora gifhornensis TaxID=84594 RepID=UPI0036478375